MGDQSTTEIIKTPKKYTKSGGDLQNEQSDGTGSDESARSGYSGHSEEDYIETLNVKNNQKVKKKKHGKFAQSADVDDFAMQVMRAKKVTKKRDFDEEERGRSKKKREFAPHGRSISLSGANLMHSGGTKKKKGTKGKLNKTEEKVSMLRMYRVNHRGVRGD